MGDRDLLALGGILGISDHEGAVSGDRHDCGSVWTEAAASDPVDLFPIGCSLCLACCIPEAQLSVAVPRHHALSIAGRRDASHSPASRVALLYSDFGEISTFQEVNLAVSIASPELAGCCTPADAGGRECWLLALFDRQVCGTQLGDFPSVLEDED